MGAQEVQDILENSHGGRQVTRGRTFSKFWRAREGQGLVEYVLIIAVVAMAAVTVLTLFGGNLTVLLNNIVTSV